MDRNPRIIIALGLGLALAITGHAWGTEPAAQLGQQIDRVFKALDDPAMKDRVAERRAAVRRIVDEVFSFDETARRTLGRHWAERTPAEQAHFTRLFTDLIDRAYLRKVELYDGEQRVVVTGQSIDGEQAVVHSAVVTKDQSQIAVDYVMLRGDDDGWRVYDIRIAGMSLVALYRAQFNKIIQTSSFDNLVKRLEAKVAAFQ